MLREVIIAIVLSAMAVYGQNPSTTAASCKNPTVIERLMRDDVRYASPFYVIALPKTPKTSQIDNVCYTYFENGDEGFFHIMSVVYQNGSHTYHKFLKEDISDRIGLAQGTAQNTSSCVYHDYTLTPICNVSVFILYRCYIEGNCQDDIDVGITSGVDVRVTLAATPTVSEACRSETEAALKDTTALAGGDYVILPQRHQPKCVTQYNGRTSINAKNAVGFTDINEDTLNVRFGDSSDDLFYSGGTVSSHPGPVYTANTPLPSPVKPSYADVVKTGLNPTKSAKRPNVYNHVRRHSTRC